MANKAPRHSSKQVYRIGDLMIDHLYRICSRDQTRTLIRLTRINSSIYYTEENNPRSGSISFAEVGIKSYPDGAWEQDKWLERR